MKIIKVLTRIFISPPELESIINFYQDLFKEPCSLRIDYAEKNLELAMIGSILLLAGKYKDLKELKKTKLTFLVDSLDNYLHYFSKKGITILETPKKVPTGKNMRVKHPDGIIVEYVELYNNQVAIL